MKEINAKNKVVLLIPDLHFPYHHPDSFKFLKSIKKLFKPDLVVCLGDEIDNSSISFHDSDAELFSAGHELEEALKYIQQLEGIFPKMSVLESNHSSLVMRRMKKHGIPIRHMKSLKEIFGTKRWEWYNELLLKTNQSSVYVCHGKSGAYNKLAKEKGCSAIQGHFHSKLEITWAKSATFERFNAFGGCLIDAESLAFAYGRNNIPSPLLGCIVINKKGFPQIIKMGEV